MTDTPILPVKVQAALTHGPDRSNRIEYQVDASGEFGRLVAFPTGDPSDKDATRWQDRAAALNLWQQTWDLLEALGQDVV